MNKIQLLMKKARENEDLFEKIITINSDAELLQIAQEAGISLSVEEMNCYKHCNETDVLNECELDSVSGGTKTDTGSCGMPWPCYLSKNYNLDCYSCGY